MNWAEVVRRAEARFADGTSRIPAEPDGRQKQLVRVAMAAGAAGLGELMADRDEEAAAWFLRSVDAYRASWDDAPPGSWGRPIGALKSAVLSGDMTASAETATWASSLGAGESDSTIGWYAAALAALVLARDEEAAGLADRLAGEATFPAATARALAAVAHREPARYREAVTEILADFEARTDYLEDVPVADTVLVLEALAERRGLAVRPASPLLPARA
jgi:hypothetical protein